MARALTPDFTFLPWAQATLSRCATHLLVGFILCSLLSWNAFAGVIFAEDLQLRGEAPSYSVPVYVEGTTSKAVSFKFRWDAASLVDRQRSIAQLLVDGQVRSSRRLSDLAQGTWEVNLRPLRAGKHDVRIELILRSREDDCFLSPESLWVTLLSDSQMAGAALTTQSAIESVVAVREVPENWRRKLATESSDQSSALPVLFTHDFAWDRQMAAAFLQTQLLLRQQGLGVGIGQGGNSNGRSLSLRSRSQLPPEHAASLRWQSLKDPRYILYAPGPRQLEVIVERPEDAYQALQVLANPDLLQLCNERICSLSASEHQLSKASDTKSESPSQPRLWAMAESDQPRGWTARGIGSHTLRQVWLRPVSMALEAEVHLHLAARVSQAVPVDQALSSISLTINEQPMATYSLADWKAGHAQIRIPQSLWGANVWVLDFEVRLTPRSDLAADLPARKTTVGRCTRTIQEDYWVTIDPSTRLHAKYRLVESQSIAGFWQRAIEQPVQSVFWNAAQQTLPNPQELAAIAPVLQDFQSPLSLRTLRRWEFVDRATCADRPCIVLDPVLSDVVSNTSQSNAVLPWKHLLKRRPELARTLPDLNSQTSAALVWEPKDGVQSEQLHLVFGRLGDAPLTPAQLPTFSGEVATYANQWQVFAIEPSQRQLASTAPASGAGNVSQQQSRLRWINLLWALGSILIVTALCVTYWRKKKKADAKSWEVNG